MLQGKFAPRPGLLQVPSVLGCTEVLSLLVSVVVMGLYFAAAYLPWFRKAPPNSLRKACSSGAAVLGLLCGVLLAWFFCANAAQWQLTPPHTIAQALANFDPIQASWTPAYLVSSGNWQSLRPTLGAIFVPALFLALLNTIDSLTAAGAMEAKADGAYHPTRELIGQGLGNLLSAMAGGVAVSGTPSRTEFNYVMGGRTRLAGVVSALVIAMIVFKLWFWVGLLAVPVLAALVAAVGVQMVIRNRHALWPPRDGPKHGVAPNLTAVWIQRSNLLIVWMMVLLALLLALPLLWVLGAGLFVTVAVWIHQTSDKLVFRHYSGMERRSLEQRSPENQHRLKDNAHRVQVLELEGDLFFVNALKMRESLHKCYEVEPKTKETQYLVIDFSRVHEIDSTSAASLAKALQALQKKWGIKVWLSYVKDNTSLLTQLNQAIDYDVLPAARWTRDTEEALEAIEDELLTSDGNESTRCVLLKDLLGAHDVEAADISAFEELYLPRLKVNKGDKFYEPGSAAQNLYLLESGDVRLILVPTANHDDTSQQDPRKSRTKRLAALNPGAIFGADALLPDQPLRSVRAVAYTSCTAWQINVARLAGADATHPEIVRQLYKLIAVEMTERLASVASELALVDA